jgi:hypothetical protein
MKSKFIAISSIIIFFFAILWNGLIHLVVLKSANSSIETLHRPDFADKLWLSLIVTFFISVLFSISYIRWRKDGSLIETITHSLFFAVLIGIVVDLNQYVLYPIPFMLVMQWFLFGILEFIIYGIIVWRVHKKMNPIVAK